MVTKCVCSDILFSDMKLTADKYGLKSINELKEYIEVSNNCQFYHPYIELMIKSGKTEFEPVFE